VWSRQVGIDQRSRVAAMQLVAGRRARVDVGRVRVDGKHGHYFLMMAGVGADGAVMSRVTRSAKNRLGALAVGVAAVEALPALKTVDVVVEMDGIRWDGRISEMIAGNIRDYGGFTRITDGAFVDDGLLDVVLFTADGIVPAMKQLASLLVRKHPDDSSSETYRGRRVAVRSEHSLPLQVDGSDVPVPDKSGGPISYEFDVVPASLTVVLPNTYDGAIFRAGPDAFGPPIEGKKGKKKRKK
jgi:diacylglycerol kinase family enzyme